LAEEGRIALAWLAMAVMGVRECEASVRQVRRELSASVVPTVPESSESVDLAALGLVQKPDSLSGDANPSSD
jgi:hypothetical protein